MAVKMTSSSAKQTNHQSQFTLHDCGHDASMDLMGKGLTKEVVVILTWTGWVYWTVWTGAGWVYWTVWTGAGWVYCGRSKNKEQIQSVSTVS
jgi:hypothetical protein